jgi:DNA helicase-2/ATP-dependent DNA helicase PcrA
MKKISELPYFVKEEVLFPKATVVKPVTSSECVLTCQRDAHYFRLLESRGIYLNQQQIEAVRASIGPVLINSIPGSGKSTVITCKIGYLITVEGIKPENILAITFTKKAALSLSKKLQELNVQGSKDVLATTFHSLCLRIMKLAGLRKFNILSSDKQKEYIIKEIMKELRQEDFYATEKILAKIASVKTALIPSGCSIEQALTAEQLLIFNKYEDFKKEKNLLDFDDLLFNGWKILKTSRYILGILQKQFQHVTCDEYQDLCPIEHEIVKMIVSPLNNVFAVGDSAQNIFSFRGSDVRYLLDFEKEYMNAKTLSLNVNYRSTAPIIALSDNLLKSIGMQRNSLAVKDGTINPRYINANDSIEEAKLIAEAILEMVNKNKTQPKDIAVLYRSSSSSEFIVEELTINNIPFVDYSLKELIYSDNFVKPLIDYLRLSIDHQDISALSGVLSSLYLNKTLTLAWLNQNNQEDKSLFEVLLYMPTLKDYHYEILSKRECIINSIKYISPVEAIRKMRSDFYDKYMKVNDFSILTIPKQTLVDMLIELEESASRFKTIPEFIEYIEILTRKYAAAKNNMADENIDAVSLMSMHKSKGLEFPIVFISSVIENVIPHKRAIDEAILSDRSSSDKSTLNDVLDEECRLLYVAMTRSKRELYISIPRYCNSYIAEASRFLRDAFQPI